MGLREDAEAARLSAIEAEEARQRAIACERDRREQERRDKEEDEAREAALDVGIGELEDAVWVTDPPVSKGYNALTYLQLRSPDGVWLRYSQYRRMPSEGGLEHRWMVVQKCPVDDHWVMPGSWATTLSMIGSQLHRTAEALDRHLERAHPEYTR